MDYSKWVNDHYPDVYESMHDMDMYHVAEYCEWFFRGFKQARIEAEEE